MAGRQVQGACRERAVYSLVFTDLFAVASALDASAIMGAIPPACRRKVEAAPAVTHDGDDLLLEFGPWRPREGARHLVPAFSALSDRLCSFRFEASTAVAGGWSPWIAAVSIGPAEFAPVETESTGLETQIDFWTAVRPVEAVRLRLRLRADGNALLLAAPWLVTLSACDLAPVAPGRASGAARLAVPALSQMAAGAAIAARICSPTSVAMVLAYWRMRDDVGGLAAEMFHPALDLYGVWPAAIRAAARRGVLGYLLRFPDWASAAWCLDRGLPVVASVRYAAGELGGAAIAETSGHLLVLTGYEDGAVLVNDPAAPDAASVPRRYPLQQIVRVWLERAGVGYVLFRPDAR
ncbi:MAG: hypothetical protein AUH29_13125 [Candidatus Rokubacteria bacterium 13_1_40CM_69_27]|nr:MAG: hypothetical protein AUH29_13125 [Candidatus Rokubacteria bacterium 13_1_40CM_69_27]